MPQIFYPSTNTLSRVSIAAVVLSLAAFAMVGAGIQRSPYFTDVGVPREQPVPFSHAHHVAGLGIDCRYCHTTVETSSFAGIPPTETCMSCHRQIWSDSPMLEPVRESYRSGRPLEWTRVHDLADFVYFDHSIHVAKGIGCASCHGRVDTMPLTWRVATLHMDWCLDCHRNPGPHLRPVSRVFDMTWEPPPDHAAHAGDLVRERGIEKRTDCGACHR
jgi:Cytochrome c7 and related cytochrome c